MTNLYAGANDRKLFGQEWAASMVTLLAVCCPADVWVIVINKGGPGAIYMVIAHCRGWPAWLAVQYIWRLQGRKNREVALAKVAPGPSHASVTPPWLIHHCLCLCLSLSFPFSAFSFNPYVFSSFNYILISLIPTIYSLSFLWPCVFEQNKEGWMVMMTLSMTIREV